MSTRARILHRSSALAEPFGADYAGRLFGPDVVAALPRITRGPNAGRPRGHLHWQTAESGGWWTDETGRGRVVRPGLVCAALRAEKDENSQLLSGLWLGEVRPLRGTADMLGPEGRAATIERQVTGIEAALADERTRIASLDALIEHLPANMPREQLVDDRRRRRETVAALEARLAGIRAAVAADS
jgi:hypothetical protein